MRPLLLGCIADDFTGATDLASNLVRAGMRVVQTIGIPRDTAALDADAVVVALKSRTIPADEAVAQSLAACRWLRAKGAGQIYFKVCSTFDSTPRGNIGPVMEALMDELDCRFSIVTPAFPDNGRTVFKGYLFVGDVPLSESGMRDHPLTPMRDANLVRVLQAQLDRDAARRVGLIDYRCVGDSPAAIVARMDALAEDGVSLAIVDALDNDDLMRLGAAVKTLALVCAGSGLAIGLPANWGITPSTEAARLPVPKGSKAIVSGSCSNATNGQVMAFIRAGGAARAIDPLALAVDETALERCLVEAAQWARDAWRAQPGQAVLIYSTAEPDTVKAVQASLGVEAAGSLVERTLAALTRSLVEHGARQLVVAGGETSGACVQALAIEQMQIGGQIDPGVPWCHAASPVAGGEGLHVALKSGNFGGVDFFTRAFAELA